MISFIKGKVENVAENYIEIETGGVGFELISTASAVFEFTPKNGEENKVVKIPTYMNVREDALQLFGFASVAEKALFLRLITVSGVGPKLAITILSGLDAKELAMSIALGDVTSLSRIKGLGKKTAEKIIVELKEKMPVFDKLELQNLQAYTKSGIVNEEVEDAIIALSALGLTKADCQKYIDKVVKDGMKAEEIIKLVLKEMSK